MDNNFIILNQFEDFEEINETVKNGSPSINIFPNALNIVKAVLFSLCSNYF